MTKNTLYFGDNLDVLKQHVKDESVDLIYLDPPFNSKKDYNLLFKTQDGSRSAAQIMAFEDTWRWDEGTASVYRELVEAGGEVARVMGCFREVVGESDMLAYLAMMAPRLQELRRVLKPKGSIYLHCDPTASHYLKLLMDATLGPTRCVNEIIWHYYNKIQGNIGHFPENHDTIFWYSKEAEFPFNVIKEKREKRIRQLKRVWDGQKKKLVNAKGPDGKCIYIETDERRIDDVWTLPMLQPASREMLGYPTQKPEALLERIITASSNKGDLVLDPFCGCGTAVSVAQRTDRQWIGIDITHLAVNVMKNRLHLAYGLDAKRDYTVKGEPGELSEALALARLDPHHFEHWALGLVGARASAKAKGADGGIDGWLGFFLAQNSLDQGRVIVSVKSGKNIHVSMVRELCAVVEREKAEIGVLILMEEPTQPMRAWAGQAGHYTCTGRGTKHRKIQLLTVADLLGGKKVDCPPTTLSGDVEAA